MDPKCPQWLRRHGMDCAYFQFLPGLDQAGTYAWPAVHATGSDVDWDALSGILTSAEFEQYSAFRESGWLGLPNRHRPGRNLALRRCGRLNRTALHRPNRSITRSSSIGSGKMRVEFCSAATSVMV